MSSGAVSRRVAATAAVLVAFLSGTAFAAATWRPPDDTITSVAGTRDSGFHVQYHGMPDVYLPTASEAAAECGEYRLAAKRIRCRTYVRTRYRDLGDTKRAVRYARSHSR